MKTLIISFFIAMTINFSVYAFPSEIIGSGYKSVGSLVLANQGRAKKKNYSSSSRSRNNWSSSRSMSSTKSKVRIKSKSNSKKKVVRKLKPATTLKGIKQKKRIAKNHSPKTIKKLAQQKAKAENKSLKQLANTRIGSNRTTINQAREDYYQPQMNSFRNIYGHNSYGGYDGGFLISEIMSSAINTRLWYAMSVNPGYSSMMRDFRSTATSQGNEEVLYRLDEIEASIAAERSSGVAPLAMETVIQEEGIPVEVALSEEILLDETKLVPTVRFGAGLKGGNYLAKCEEISDTLSQTMNVNCIESAGGDINLNEFCVGAYDAILTQSDLIADKLENVPTCNLQDHYQTVIYDEVTFLIGSMDTKHKSVKDIPKSSIIYVGPKGSGPAKSWEKIVAQDPNRYGPKRFKIRYADYDTAAQIVLDSNNTYMFYVSATNSKFMQKLEETNNFSLIAMDDWDFNDKKDKSGESIYEMVDMPKEVYPNMQKRVKGYRNLTVQAVVILNYQFAEEYGEEFADNFITAIELIKGADYNF